MYSDLEFPDFQGENLQGADFQMEQLENARFQGANLKGSNFQGVNLQGAKFQGADLKDANLQSADLHEANFKGAKLHGANLKECKDIKIANWSKAEYDHKTQFPFDFNPDERGLVRTYRRGQSAIKEFGEQSIDETDIKIKIALIEIRKSIQKRQGQRKFRDELIKVYQGRCALTGCKVTGVIEAAHVKPYHISKENHPKNGILLRADLHTLFDLNLIVIHPETKTIEIKHSLQTSGYQKFDGIILPSHRKNVYSPDDHYLEWRYQNYEEHIASFLQAPCR